MVPFEAVVVLVVLSEAATLVLLLLLLLLRTAPLPGVPLPAIAALIDAEPAECGKALLSLLHVETQLLNPKPMVICTHVNETKRDDRRAQQ